MGRWLLLFALPILGCALVFQSVLVPAENFSVNFFGVGHSYGAPFVVGVGPTPPLTGATPLPVPERFSVVWFAIDVIVTAGIAAVIAWFIRMRNAWAASVGATVAVGLFMAGSNGSPPISIRSFGFSFWIYWLVTFGLMAAAWVGLELDRVFGRVIAREGPVR
jgi:hypothetical protein